MAFFANNHDRPPDFCSLNHNTSSGLSISRSKPGRCTAVTDTPWAVAARRYALQLCGPNSRGISSGGLNTNPLVPPSIRAGHNVIPSLWDFSRISSSTHVSCGTSEGRIAILSIPLRDKVDIASIASDEYPPSDSVSMSPARCSSANPANDGSLLIIVIP